MGTFGVPTYGKAAKVGTQHRVECLRSLLSGGMCGLGTRDSGLAIAAAGDMDMRI